MYLNICSFLISIGFLYYSQLHLSSPKTRISHLIALRMKYLLIKVQFIVCIGITHYTTLAGLWSFDILYLTIQGVELIEKKLGLGS